mgnify:CR=1 FL=1|jgi:hypothetical protein
MVNVYTFLGALVITGVYLLFRFLEMRFVLKKNQPLKFLLREALMVYFSVLGGDFVLRQIQPLNIGSNVPTVFTSPPDF